MNSSSKKELWILEKDKAERVMEGEFHIKVPITDDLRRRQPFHDKLPSDHVVSNILSYLGPRARVCQLLQHMNQEGRAFCIQNDGLKNVLDPNPFVPSYFRYINEWEKQMIFQLRQDKFE